jgi:hypothetical protein
MFRLALKRGLAEGWGDFRPFLCSFVNTVNWGWTQLRPDLRPMFEIGAAELWVAARMALDATAFEGLDESGFTPPDFAFHVRRKLDRLVPTERNFGLAHLDSIRMHPSIMRALARPGVAR